MSNRPSLDERIAEAEKEFKNMSGERQERIRLQGFSSFTESMRLNALRQRVHPEKKKATANGTSEQD